MWSFSGFFTNDVVFLFVLQVTNGDEVALHHGNVAVVLAGDDGGLAVQRHLVVVLHRCVLFVGDLQGALGDVVNLARAGGMKHVLIGDLGSISPDWMVQTRYDFRQSAVGGGGISEGWQMIISCLLYGYGVAR